MDQGVSLGEFEQLILLAILRLGDDAYGVSIRNEILVCTHREVSPGALYTTLDRREQQRNGRFDHRQADPRTWRPC